MRRNYLQRLLSPPGTQAFSGIDTFRGIPQEALSELFKIANFDYMGSTNFELGVIGKSLRKICENRPAYKLHEKVIKGKKFFILIQIDRLNKYCDLIEAWSVDNYHDEYHGLKDVFNGNMTRGIQGWLDISDDVIFFTNEDMAKKMDSFLIFE